MAFTPCENYDDLERLLIGIVLHILWQRKDFVDASTDTSQTNARFMPQRIENNIDSNSCENTVITRTKPPPPATQHKYLRSPEV